MPVLIEATHFLETAHKRRTLWSVIQRLHIDVLPYRGDIPWQSVFEGLLAYEEHEPDFVDALQMLMVGQKPSHIVWSFDSAFTRYGAAPKVGRRGCSGRKFNTHPATAPLPRS